MAQMNGLMSQEPVIHAIIALRKYAFERKTATYVRILSVRSALGTARMPVAIDAYRTQRKLILIAPVTTGFTMSLPQTLAKNETVAAQNEPPVHLPIVLNV